MGVLSIFLFITSCYSVRIVSTYGAPTPDPNNDNDDDYRNKKMIVIDTIIKSGVTTAVLELKTSRIGCTSGKLHSVEYKNTFAGSLSVSYTHLTLPTTSRV